MSQKPKSHRLKLVRQRYREGRAPVKPSRSNHATVRADGVRLVRTTFSLSGSVQVECEGEDQETVR